MGSSSSQLLSGAAYSRLSLSIFLIPILIALLVLLDSVLLGQRIKLAMPETLTEAFWYPIFFGTPHVIASHFLLFEKKVFLPLAPKLIAGFFVCAAAVLILRNVAPNIWVIFFALYASKHTIGQQTNIGKSLFKNPPARYTFLANIVGISFISFFSLRFLNIRHDIRYPAFEFALACVIVVISLIGFYLTKRISDQEAGGKKFLAANLTGLFFSASLFILGYKALAFFIFRLMHDVTAFSFYVSSYCKRKSGDSRSAKGTLLVGVIFIIAIPMFLAGLLQFNYQAIANKDALLIMTIFHYFTESVVWKKDSPLRVN